MTLFERFEKDLEKYGLLLCDETVPCGRFMKVLCETIDKHYKKSNKKKKFVNKTFADDPESDEK